MKTILRDPEIALWNSTELTENTISNTHFLKETKQTNPVAIGGYYRPTGRRFSAKLVPTFAGRGVSHGQHNGFPLPSISGF
jgi:hypothetical protein